MISRVIAVHADAAAPTHEHLEQLPYLRAVVQEVRSRRHDCRKTRLQTSSCMPDCIAAQLEPISHCPASTSIRHNLILERCRATRFAGACAGAAAVPGNSHLPARSSGGRRAAVRRPRVGRCCMTDLTPAHCSSLLQQPCLPSVTDLVHADLPVLRAINAQSDTLQATWCSCHRMPLGARQHCGRTHLTSSRYAGSCICSCWGFRLPCVQARCAEGQPGRNAAV